LSILQLCDKGNRAWFDESQYAVKNAKSIGIVLHGFKLDNVYATSLDHISPIHLSYLKASHDDVWLWQHRLGNASMHALPKLVKHDLTWG